ncbi:BRCT domain - like 6 [Theobroma cacao]|nr:BRCT domain - like 6 [Theobroma cacao]
MREPLLDCVEKSDIRKWFMKAHDKGKGNASKPANPAPTNTDSVSISFAISYVPGGRENSGRRKTSKYFPAGKQQPKGEQGTEELPAKRKVQNENESVEKPPPSKKPSKVGIDDDFVLPKSRNTVDVTPSKKRKSGSGRGVAQKAEDNDESDEDDAKDLESPVKSGGRGGRGGTGASVAPASGRGRGRGRGGFMNFGERKDPPHKGEKEVPEGAPDCLAGLTFVISGTLDSLEREEAEDLIKRHGGRITTAVSKKTNYLLCDEDIEGRKSSKAKELGIPFLTEDGLFDMIRASNCGKAHSKEESKKSAESFAASLPKKSPQKMEVKSMAQIMMHFSFCCIFLVVDHIILSERSVLLVFNDEEPTDTHFKPLSLTNAASCIGNSSSAKISGKSLTTSVSSTKQRGQPIQHSSLTWTEKYRPKVPNEMTGNQSLGKGKKQNDPGAKKAVLLSGTPGIGKTTSAKLVSQMLGFQTIEVELHCPKLKSADVYPVNASDSRGKADAKISKGIGGSNANSIKELVSNEALSVNMDRSKHVKTVLIMDEVDGMSAGDRGGIADLIASIKISKIPIICICNDRYSQKLKSLVNYCLLLSFRKPTKQQTNYMKGFHICIFAADPRTNHDTTTTTSSNKKTFIYCMGLITSLFYRSRYLTSGQYTQSSAVLACFGHNS